MPAVIQIGFTPCGFGSLEHNQWDEVQDPSSSKRFSLLTSLFQPQTIKRLQT